MTTSPSLKPRLLLIEDNADRIAFFRQWLVGTPYVLIEATTGGQALGVINRGGGDGIAGICLDHDLSSSPKTPQDELTSGTNVVSAIIARMPKTVPILVHSMSVKAEQMVRRLQVSGFSVTKTRMQDLDKIQFQEWLQEVNDCWEDRMAG